MKFLATEAEISARTGHAIGAVRLFELAGLGVSFDALRRQVASSFADLPWDQYDVRRAQIALLAGRYREATAELEEFLSGLFAGERQLSELQRLLDGLSDPDRARLVAIAPYRRRAVATFLVRKADRDGWSIEREPHTTFTQAGDHERDYRRLQRHFAPSSVSVTDAPAYRAVIHCLATLTNGLHDRSLTTLRVVCHQLGLKATPDGTSNAPEGIHQDGADYIVSALVLERRAVTGGESVVYGPDKRTEYLRHTLQEGQGLFQADRQSQLWHTVTPIRPTSDFTHGGIRNVLGYDIHILD